MAADQVLVNHSQVEVVAEGVNVHGVPDFITLLSEEHGELQQKVVRRSSPGQRDTDGKRRRYSNSKLSQSEYLCKTDLADSANSECLSVRSAMYETVLHLKGKDLLFQPLQQRLLCTAHLKALLHCDSHRSLLRSFCKQL